MQLDSLYSRVISVLIALVLVCGLGLAQTKSTSDSSLEIVVKDPTGAVINNARLLLTKDGRPEATTRTNQKGEARFSHIVPSRSQLQVAAPGFKSRDLELSDLRPGSNHIEVMLEIDPIKVDVEVGNDAQARNSDPNGPAFTNVLTADQIAALPDDPDEFENAINQLAGPGAQIRVNGFRGGKLPPKSQIR